MIRPIEKIPTTKTGAVLATLQALVLLAFHRLPYHINAPHPRHH